MSLNDAIETEEYKGYTIKLFTDNDLEDPRGWDNLGTMIFSHQKYDLGDKKTGYDPKDYNFNIKELIKAIEADLGPIIVRLVYMYDHSSIAFSMFGNTYPFNDQFDAGVIGIIFAPKSKVREEWQVKRISPKLMATVISNFESELETYQAYINGWGLGYIIEDEDEEEIDSLWGFYGDSDYVLKSAQESIDRIIEHKE